MWPLRCRFLGLGGFGHYRGVLRRGGGGEEFVVVVLRLFEDWRGWKGTGQMRICESQAVTTWDTGSSVTT